MPPAGRASERTRIQLCGRLSVEVGGAELSGGLRGKQVRLLLAYLVLNRSRYVSRDELIDAVWPYTAPRSEDAALRTLLSRLRSALGHATVVGRDELTLRLPEPVWIDLEAAGTELQRATQTLEGGDARGAWALAQVPLNIAARGLLPGSTASWLEHHRRQLEDIRLEALEVIGRAGLQLGGSQIASVERAARSLIDSEPYRESGYALLMEVNALRGNVAEGLRVFERLRMLLRDELGTSPAEQTIALHDRLLHPQSRSAAPETERGPARIELPPELRAAAKLALVGRRTELKHLEQLWSSAVGERDAAAERGRVILLAGDPGVGKTRLATELAQQAHRGGALVLTGRAAEETVVPYQPFLEALRHYLLGAPLGHVRAHAREYGSELARLVPELRRRAPELPPPEIGEAETERYRLFEAVVGLLRSVSESMPILLFLDDLHWADTPTLLMFRHLARAAHPAHLLILGAYRSTEAFEPLTTALAELRRERLVGQLDIGGLSEAETAELVRVRTAETPSESFARVLYEETSGNPFFVEEMVRHLANAGVQLGSASARELQRFGLPEGVKDVIARRLARLRQQTAEWLRVAAVIGRDFEIQLLEQVVAFGEDEFLNALDEAVESGLVVDAGDRSSRYSFSHALVRETLYDGMSGPRRSRIHLRVAQALEAAEADATRNAPLLAYHFARADRPQEAEKAISYARLAARQATEMLAHEEAIQHYSRALEVLDRFQLQQLDLRLELLILLGEARGRSGIRALARPTFTEAAALAETLGDAESLARVALGAGRRHVHQPGATDDELVAMLERALELNPRPTVTRVRLLARLCGALYYSPQRGRMKALSDEASGLAQRLESPEAEVYAHAARRRALWDPFHLGERLEASTEMLKLARQLGNLELELQGHAWLVVDLLERGDGDAVDAQIEAFCLGAERLGQPLYTWCGVVWRAMRACLAGRLGEAEQLAGRALAAETSAKAETAPHYHAIQLLAIRREQLRTAELEATLRELAEVAPVRAVWDAAVAVMLCETGRSAEAAALFEQLAGNSFEDLPQDAYWMARIALLSDICATLRDGVRANLLYERLLPYGDAQVVIGLAALCLGSASRFLGKLAAASGREADAARHFEQALEANAALKAPLCVAHTQLDYAALLGAGPQKRELIEAAARTAAELNLPLVSRRASEARRS